MTAIDSYSSTTKYYVQFRNKCTKSNTYDFNWVAVSGQENVLSEFTAEMAWKGNNRYEYSYSVTRPGEITINVLKYRRGGVWAQFYAVSSWPGTPQHKDIFSSISKNWGSGYLYGSRKNSVWIKVIVD